jgi:hypothetical protein
VPDDFVHACLVNTGSGTPFISGLALRPLIKSSLYPQENATQGSFNGEVTYMTNSPRLSWLNHAKGWIEGINDQKNGEATIKVYPAEAKAEKTPQVAAPMM